MGGGYRAVFALINIYCINFPPLFNTIFYGDL